MTEGREGSIRTVKIKTRAALGRERPSSEGTEDDQLKGGSDCPHCHSQLECRPYCSLDDL